MAESPSQRDVLGEFMASSKKELIPYLAEMMRTRRVQEVGTAEMRRRFWQPAITDDEEQRLWEEEMVRDGLTPDTLTPEHVLRIGLKLSQIKYPDRWDLAGQEGRTTDAQKSMWAYQMAEKGPPEVSP